MLCKDPYTGITGITYRDLEQKCSFTILPLKEFELVLLISLKGRRWLSNKNDVVLPLWNRKGACHQKQPQKWCFCWIFGSVLGCSHTQYFTIEPTYCLVQNYLLEILVSPKSRPWPNQTFKCGGDTHSYLQVWTWRPTRYTKCIHTIVSDKNITRTWTWSDMSPRSSRLNLGAIYLCFQRFLLNV